MKSFRPASFQTGGRAASAHEPQLRISSQVLFYRLTPAVFEFMLYSTSGWLPLIFRSHFVCVNSFYHFIIKDHFIIFIIDFFLSWKAVSLFTLCYENCNSNKILSVSVLTLPALYLPFNRPPPHFLIRVLLCCNTVSPNVKKKKIKQQLQWWGIRALCDIIKGTNFQNCVF